ncbi:hypothetical protein [Thermoproteus uzoniensis]|uniref:hypothetical protein n=1 Tax=Thermoproteus uzoniensis TaxID=184117 RepID=UPI001F43DC32|nr:hypothetical protein [Thermoproteus uzoniensis]
MDILNELQKKGVKFYAYKAGGLTIAYIMDGEVDAKPEKTVRAGGHIFMYFGDVVLVKREATSQAPGGPSARA